MISEGHRSSAYKSPNQSGEISPALITASVREGIWLSFVSQKGFA
jgi:hypothetical protein